jgi:hypothetical protein
VDVRQGLCYAQNMSKLDTVGWTLYGVAVGGYITLVGVRIFSWILDWLDTNEAVTNV